jgi:cyclophilin family peptidyl-prolyl cis-trans isomerase
MRAAALLLLAGCAAAPTRVEQLLQMARRQDPADLGQLTSALGSRAPAERMQAAFALGQLGVAWDGVEEPARVAAADALGEQLPRETDAAVRDRLVEALGKLGGATAVMTLTASLEGAERGRAAVALGLLFKNQRLAEPVALPKLTALLDDGDPEVRFSAAYALYRMKAAPEALEAHLDDGSWLVRATCARAPLHPQKLAPLVDDPDERVAAEAARSLARSAAACPWERPCPALVALAGTGTWRPQVAAAVAAEPVTHPSAALLYSTRAGKDCHLALAHDRALGRVELLPRCDGDARRRAQYAARALGEAKGDPAIRLRSLLALGNHAEAAVRAEVALALGKLAFSGADGLILQLFSDENDLAVLAALAEVVAERRLQAAGGRIFSRLASLRGPSAVETLQALCAAAARLQLKPTIPRLRELAKDAHPALRAAARQALKDLGEPLAPWQPPKVAIRAAHPDHSVKLLTPRGPIVIRVFGEVAHTVENFLKLTRARFYDRTSFHRVVPGFVAQGGDPRGDGSGGPGWMIPCEVNPRRYREGTVGMALSGRDTGGSQFFIALSPQPHLDGRYTVFGEVVEGLDAARALGEGDRIVSARVVE